MNSDTIYVLVIKVFEGCIETLKLGPVGVSSTHVLAVFFSKTAAEDAKVAVAEMEGVTKPHFDLEIVEVPYNKANAEPVIERMREIIVRRKKFEEELAQQWSTDTPGTNRTTEEVSDDQGKSWFHDDSLFFPSDDFEEFYFGDQVEEAYNQVKEERAQREEDERRLPPEDKMAEEDWLSGDEPI